MIIATYRKWAKLSQKQPRNANQKLRPYKWIEILFWCDSSNFKVVNDFEGSKYPFNLEFKIGTIVMPICSIEWSHKWTVLPMFSLNSYSWAGWIVTIYLQFRFTIFVMIPQNILTSMVLFQTLIRPTRRNVVQRHRRARSLCRRWASVWHWWLATKVIQLAILIWEPLRIISINRTAQLLNSLGKTKSTSWGYVHHS